MLKFKIKRESSYGCHVIVEFLMIIFVIQFSFLRERVLERERDNKKINKPAYLFRKFQYKYELKIELIIKFKV